MSHARNALTPDALAMMDAIARTGSFAAAARELGKVPSALTYSVRQLEDALDVLLFDRSSRQAAAHRRRQRAAPRRPPPAASEMDAVANRVRARRHRLGDAADDRRRRRRSRARRCSSCARRSTRCAPPELHDGAGPGTRLRLRTEVLAGTWEALVTGQADLAIGVAGRPRAPARHRDAAARATLPFVFVRRAAPPAGRADRAARPTPSWCTTAPSPWPTRRSAWRR